ncbi:MAG: hypothetical protein ACLPVY_11290 [Acidimicrobiia bacterium]
MVVWGAPAGSAPPPAIVARLTSNGETTDALNSASCVSATTCFAVGASYGSVYGPPNPASAFAGRWNGKSFSISPTPTPAGATSSALVGVSCTSATNCFAVGGSSTKSAPPGTLGTTLIERWNGKTWSIVPSPPPDYITLNGVSCISATFCIAVGTAVEQWNGKTWSIVASPSPPGQPYELDGVSCASRADCAAVGYYSSPIDGEWLPWFEQWNGKRWSFVAGPNPAGSDPQLSDVSCPSRTTCVAVGSSIDKSLVNPPGVGSGPWTTRWNHNTWSLVSPSDFNARSDALDTLSCTSPTNCFAVGSFDNSTTYPLVERWNGKIWSVVAAAASASGTGGLFNGVSCTTSTDCLAVGSVIFNEFDHTALVEHWNGKSWTIVPS